MHSLDLPVVEAAVMRQLARGHQKKVVLFPVRRDHCHDGDVVEVSTRADDRDVHRTTHRCMSDTTTKASTIHLVKAQAALVNIEDVARLVDVVALEHGLDPGDLLGNTGFSDRSDALFFNEAQ